MCIMNRRAPRKIITRVIAFLLLLVAGAMVNVAVAWLFPQRLFAVRHTSALPNERRDDLWREHAIPRPRSFPPLQGTIYAEQTIRFGSTTEAVVLQFLLPHVGHDDFVVMEVRTGLPCRSMWGVVVARVIGRPTAPSETLWYERFIALPLKSAKNPQFIAGHAPLGIVWPGFAINTLFCTGVLWLLFAAPFALRRWRRIKRGLCPACAYPVGESATCTECGRPVNPRRMLA
jgi:hypothetical protein